MENITKICKRCGLEKPVSMFSIFKTRIETPYYNSICVECKNEKEKLRYQQKAKNPEFLEKERLRRNKRRLKAKEEDNQKYYRERNIRYKQKYKYKDQARNYCKKFPKDPENLEKHHWNYNKQYWGDIIRLSKKDHSILHRFLIYDDENLIYKTLAGIPLDTKEKHLKYVKNLLN